MNHLKEFVESLDINELGIEEYTAQLGFEKCDFDDSCDFCKNPIDGSYAKMEGYEYREAAYYICGKCVTERANDRR